MTATHPPDWRLATLPPGARHEARRLLFELGVSRDALTGDESAAEVQTDWRRTWTDAGLTHLTGPLDGPGLCLPLPLASRADACLHLLRQLLPAIHWPLGRRLLGQRIWSHGLCRQGRISAGGSARLLDAADGVLAVNLARSEDWDLLPAWLESEPVNDWEAVARLVATRDRSDLLARAAWLGLPVAADQPPRAQSCWYHACGPLTRQSLRSSAPRVLDMGVLWAGPLAGQLLAQGGAAVTKLEHPARPDGARLGPLAFFQSLHAGKRELALDLSQTAGLADFRRALNASDIVIEATRPRVLAQFGIDAAAWVADKPGRVWLSITGYGREGDAAQRVAFGDDAAVSGGLTHAVRQLSGQTIFAGDAIADPLTGLHAALLAAWCWRLGEGGLFSLPMRSVVSASLQSGFVDFPSIAGARPAA